MEFFANVLRVLDASMTTPTGYGWFHLMWWAFVWIAAVGLCLWHKRSGNPRRTTNVVLIVAVTVLLLEVYKIINFGFEYEDGVSFSFPWGSFPWQFCSTPMYIGLLAGIIRKGKVHDALCAYLATFAIFAGTAVMVYPGDVFISTIGINIQTMICHGSMITIGVYLLYSGHVKLEHKTILKALPVFVTTLCIAMVMNEVAHANGLDGFNMFYISRHEPGHLPLYGDVQNMLSCYPLELMIYIVGFTIAAYLMLLIAMGVRALGRVLFKKKATQPA